jgi:hypothetical protein
MAHAAIDFAARRPERTQALVLYNARARWLWAEDYPHGFPVAQAKANAQRVVDPDPTTDEPPPFHPAPSLAKDAGFMRWWERAGHRRASPAMAAAVLDERMQLDLRPSLPLIASPTLVIQSTEIGMLPVGHGRYLAEHIPRARLVEFPGEDMIWWVGNFHAVADEIESFLTEGRARAGRRALATVLFVDVVSSTEQAARLGDRRWRELLATYHDVAVRLIDRHGGRRVNTTGDGFLATFEIPADAVVCAGALTDAIAGIGVHIAARVMSAAEPGEVLVSRTVVDLVTGSGLDFEERGDHELKGVPGRWSLHALKR